MKVLVTGANGYIARRLIPALLFEGHEVVATVRDRYRIPLVLREMIEVIECDFLDRASLDSIPEDIEAAYYLMHSMSDKSPDYPKLEAHMARNFMERINKTSCKQILYISALLNTEVLSKHFASRKTTEEILNKANAPVTTLRAGVIIGSGSASFEIIRDCVEKLPIMICPKWVKTPCQPIAISDVIHYLIHALANEKCYGKHYDIGGPEILTYRKMMLQLAQLRGLKRFILDVPLLTPKLSSYWLYFVTRTNFSLASSLVESLKADAVCANRKIEEVIPHTCLTYKEAIERAFQKIEQNEVVSSWKDANLAHTPDKLSNFINIPKEGCVNDIKKVRINKPRAQVIERLWTIGGDNGWYAMDWAWRLRGAIDKLFGGVGLRRGRTNRDSIRPGDALDFWRVIKADRTKGELLLYAEMKVPGEAWLSFKVEGKELIQIATFRPRGILGRLYWWSMLPFHIFIFGRMAKAIAQKG